MLIRRPSDIQPSEITPKATYLSRRQWLAGAGMLSLMLQPHHAQAAKLEGITPGPFPTDEPQTPLENITSYNNFYEFGTGKDEPATNANRGTFKTNPWQVEVGGLCNKPGTLSYDELIKPHALEERIYRHRCVEGWSMVVPWVGVPLGEVLKRFEPQGNAKYVAFETLHDPIQMPGQSSSILQWPYVEGLRIDEATHPLTILAVGLYGETLPNQNGAPLRLVVPWKYGFKGIKSIVKITFTEAEPPTSWNRYAPTEYGFYSNVNPQVDHPRWSQATERRIGEFFKRDTLMFNGYAEQVASLYAGMDLKANY